MFSDLFGLAWGPGSWAGPFWFGLGGPGPGPGPAYTINTLDSDKDVDIIRLMHLTVIRMLT